MRRQSRRTVLQLTPLLDLLLIVIFAQYLDVGERDRIREAEVRDSREAAAASADQAVRAIARAEAAEQDRRAALDQAAAAQSAAAASRRTQEDTLAAVARLFDLPPEQRRRLFAPDGLFADVSAGPVRERLAELLAAKPDAVQLHLRTHEELRRLADVWRLHLDDDGVVHLLADGRETALRPSARNFVGEVYAWSKDQPEAKSLLLVLFSYGDDTLELDTRVVRAQLPRLIELLRQDTESKVDFAEIGNQPLDP